MQVPLRRGVGLVGEQSGAFEERYNNIKAVVVGAAGKTGQAITRQLLQAPNAQVKGLVRDTEAAVRSLSASVRHVHELASKAFARLSLLASK